MPNLLCNRTRIQAQRLRLWLHCKVELHLTELHTIIDVLYIGKILQGSGEFFTCGIKGPDITMAQLNRQPFLPSTRTAAVGLKVD